MKNIVAFLMGCTLLVGPGFGVVLASPIPPPQLQIPPGFNLLQTTTGTTLETGFVPSGFFGSKNGTPSDAMDLSSIPLEGLSTGPTGGAQLDAFHLGLAEHNGGDTNHATIDVRDGGGLASTDAVFERLTGATLSTVGATDNISFVIRSLSLKTVSPFQVTYGAEPPEFFEMVLELDPGSVQSVGAATLTREGQYSGTFQSSLPVTSRATFTNTNPGGPAAIASPVRTDVLTGTGTFVYVPESQTPTLSLTSMIVLTLTLLLVGGLIVRHRYSFTSGGAKA